MEISNEYPVPKDGERGSRVYRSRIPFHEMEIGQGCGFDGEDYEGKAYARAMRVEKKYGFKFAAQMERTGIRIWRIA